MKKPTNLHAERHAKFKALGLIGGHKKNNENYTPAERKKLYRLERDFGKLADMHIKPVRHRRGKENTSSTVTLKSQKEIRIMREKGYKVYKNKAVVKHAVNQTVKVARRGQPRLLTETHLKSGRVIPATELIISNKDAYKMVESGALDNLPPGTTVTGHFAGSGAFKLSRFPNAKALQRYMKAFVPKDTEGMNKKEIAALKEELIGGMGFVVVKPGK